MKISVLILILASFSIFSYLAWTFGRHLNYKFQYEDMVKETILKNVKKECLI
jgi:hypothetical protein